MDNKLPYYRYIVHCPLSIVHLANCSLNVAFSVLSSRCIYNIIEHGRNIFMADDGSGSGPANFVWAIAMIIIVGILALVVWQVGLLGGGSSKQINVDIKAPSASR